MSLSELFLKELIMVQKIHRDLISGPNPVNLAQLYNNFGATNCATLITTNGTEIGQIGHGQQRQSPIGTNLASSSRQTQIWPNGLHLQQFRTDEKRMPNSLQASHVTASGVLAPTNSLSHHHNNPNVQTNSPANKNDQNAKVNEQFEQQSSSNATQMPFELAQIVAKSDQQEKNETILNRKTSNSMPKIEGKKLENLNQGAVNDQEIDENDMLIDIETIDPFDQPEPSKRLFVDRIQPNWNDRRQCLNEINSESVGTSSSFERSTIYGSADNESASSSSSFDHCDQKANGETDESATTDKSSTKIDHLDNDWEEFANYRLASQPHLCLPFAKSRNACLCVLRVPNALQTADRTKQPFAYGACRKYTAKKEG
ncbi:hypothetical protein niasHS_015820 [Heterodera schachtii]|uniref:Uncharacterized protein n=1 Tax=Heterodera schachtii TaxID=97005 RepID=A0ABD2I4I4_HETSC